MIEPLFRMYVDFSYDLVYKDYACNSLVGGYEVEDQAWQLLHDIEDELLLVII